MIDLPIALFIVGVVVSAFLATLGFMARNKKAGMFVVIGGLLMFVLVAITDNHIMGYTQEREILTDIHSTETFTEEIITYYNVTGTDSIVSLTGGGATNVMLTEFIAQSNSQLSGKSVNCIDLYLKKTGAPTGSYYVGVWGISAFANTGNYLYLFGSGMAEDLTTTKTLYTFCNTEEAFTMRYRDAIGIFFSSGSSGNTLDAYSTTTDIFDSSNTHRLIQIASPSHVLTTTSDLQGAIYANGIDFIENYSHDTVGNEPILEPFTQESKMWWGVISVILMVLGSLIMRSES